MLKNWTVTTQVVKQAAAGVMTRERYLLSTSHRNHRNTEQIINLLGNSSTSQRIALAGEQFRTKQMLNRQGGRPLQTYAMEFCLTLPQGYRPTTEQWKLVVRDVCLTVAKKLLLTELELKHFKQRIRAVIHQQKQHGHGSGDHVHLIMPKIVGGRVLKELQRKQATRLVKQAFNTAILRHTGYDHTQYNPKTTGRSKRLSEWQYQQQEAKTALETQRLIAKLQMQSDKWFEALEINDKKQLNRQFNRLLKTFDELSSLPLSEGTSQNIYDLKKKLEQKAKRDIV
ncbi:hypothetical protein AB4403_04480 [Vibrio breoganii]